MDTATTLKRQLGEAEAKQQQLLSQIQAADAQLSKMTPADPGRSKFKSIKDELLPLYRSAKGQVKALRRAVNTLPDPKPQPDAPDERDLKPTEARLYDALTDLLDRHHTEGAILTVAEQVAIEKWLDEQEGEG